MSDEDHTHDDEELPPSYQLTIALHDCIDAFWDDQSTEPAPAERASISTSAAVNLVADWLAELLDAPEQSEDMRQAAQGILLDATVERLREAVNERLIWRQEERAKNDQTTQH